MTLRNSFRRMAAALAYAGAAVILIFAGPEASAQALSVLPVNIFFSPGQKASSLIVTNAGTTETAIQIRAFAWAQTDGTDQLTDTDAVVLSPPIATIAPGASQVIRLILRQLPQGREATYRILVDQIPPPAEPGIVHMVLRMSIPIFAEPSTALFDMCSFIWKSIPESSSSLESTLALATKSSTISCCMVCDGRKLKEESGATPYTNGRPNPAQF